MEKIRNSLINLLLVALLVGCSLPFEQPGNNQGSPSLNSVSAATTIPLTMEMLKNGEYQAQNGMALVKLVDGKYGAGSGTDYLSISMLDKVAFGDLNSDNAQDAAIILFENYGGSGEFVYLVPIFNNDGSPVPSSGYFLGDHVVVNSLDIADGRIRLDMTVHAPNDALCCPSLTMTQSFKFYWGPGLVQVHATSGIPTGGLREIIIETPGNGCEVTNQIQLSGSVSISPFENTLAIRIMDANNNQIFQGPIMVSAPDMGAPGTYETLVDLSNTPVNKGMLRIEVVDISMANGSTLAMDSVDVKLK